MFPLTDPAPLHHKIGVHTSQRIKSKIGTGSPRYLRSQLYPNGHWCIQHLQLVICVHSWNHCLGSGLSVPLNPVENWIHHQFFRRRPGSWIWIHHDLRKSRTLESHRVNGSFQKSQQENDGPHWKKRRHSTFSKFWKCSEWPGRKGRFPSLSLRNWGPDFVKVDPVTSSYAEAPKAKISTLSRWSKFSFRISWGMYRVSPSWTGRLLLRRVAQPKSPSLYTPFLT